MTASPAPPVRVHAQRLVITGPGVTGVAIEQAVEIHGAPALGLIAFKLSAAGELVTASDLVRLP